MSFTLPRVVTAGRGWRVALTCITMGGVPAWSSYSYMFGPLFAFGGLGLLILILRWAFKRGSSVVAAPPRASTPDDYGLLVSVAEPETYIEGEILRRSLEDSGIRANLAQTLAGPRVMVFPADEEKARAVLGRR